MFGRNRWILALSLLLLFPAWSEAAKKSDKAKEAQAEEESPFAESTFSGLKMRSIGPALMAGRIADIAIHPDDQSTWYVAVGSGGVWKTTNAGTTWEPIFDDQGSYSIGCITLDPNNPQIVWVGTGENVGGRHVGYGDGVYQSLDGGGSWTKMGLERSEHIGNIVIDPRDSDVVLVAAQGPLWSPGGERGLYKSSDGGQSWKKVLGGGEYTGVNEVVIDPGNPDVLYASTHQRFRNVAALINGGPESGIHKSTDGGETWRELTVGLPEEDMGKIGLAISPQRPDVVYATIELADRKGGFYRSADGGETWEKRNDYLSGGTGPHYYQEIVASPHRFDRVYQMDVRMHVTEDGGKTFTQVPEEYKHSDNHALVFDANDPNYLLSGNDGGLYESWDLGKSWKFVANLPVTQFYKVAVDYDEPFYHVIGGTQDNNTQYGPSRTDNVHGIRNGDWEITLFGDGHQPAIDPTNPDIIYSEWQQGNLVRYDRKTGEILYIQPQPEQDEEWDRFNWDAPILISAHDPARLYYASQRLWRSDDRGDSWTAVSGDLSRGLDRLTEPMMGRVWSIDAVWDLRAMSKYGTITSVGESPLDENLLYVGTDDGLIQVSDNGGGKWRAVESLPGIEKMFFVNDIKADLHDVDTVYAVVDQHKIGDFSPYIYKSTDRGRSWRSIRGDLPDRHLVWRLVQDHENPNLLFAGTEFGAFFTVDGGERWVKLSGGVPNIPFRDLVIQRRENDLVGATFGRSFYVLDDYTPLRHVDAQALEEEAILFPPRDALWYVERRSLGRSGKASQGAAFYTAPNPPFGAAFTYYLKEALESKKAQRQSREKELAEAGEDTPYPGWDALREERLAEDPQVFLTVYDAEGEVVRRLAGPPQAGIHRVVWDLRLASLDAWRKREEDDDEPVGWLVPPGTFSVQLAKKVAGVVTELGERQTFQVVPLRTNSLAADAPGPAVEFMGKVTALRGRLTAAQAVLENTDSRLDAIASALAGAAIDGAALAVRVTDLQRDLAGLKENLSGDSRRGRMSDPGPVSIERRLSVAYYGNNWSTYGPTPTHKRSLEIAGQELDALVDALTRVQAELQAVEADLDAAGVPWTPGRGVPK